jgi:ribosomal-protein-alanine N-acetyltransferase
MDVRPIVLEGDVVRLEPLEARHAASLARYAEPSLFQYFMTQRPREQSEAALLEFIQYSNNLPNMIVFATILRSTGEAVGMTSYLDIRPEHRALEIGFTWVAREHQGTKVNPECKLLLMRHAFETLGCVRVQLKTDLRNVQSQGAIEKLGAVREGVLRKHAIMRDGYIRDSVFYSVTDDEWPAVKAGLLARLQR